MLNRNVIYGVLVVHQFADRYILVCNEYMNGKESDVSSFLRWDYCDIVLIRVKVTVLKMSSRELVSYIIISHRSYVAWFKCLGYSCKKINTNANSKVSNKEPRNS